MTRGSLLSRRRLRFALALAGVLLVCLALLLATAFFAQRTALYSLAHEGEDDLKVYAAYLQSQLDELELLSTLICTNPSVEELLLHPSNAVRNRVNRGVENFGRAAGMAMVFVVDTRGTVVAASNWEDAKSLVGQDISTHPFWQIAIRDRRAHLVGFGHISGKLGYYSAAPVIHAGQQIGSVVVRQDITKLIATSSTNPDRPLLVADQHGVVFLSTIPQWWLHTVRPLEPAERQALETAEQYRDYPLSPLPMRKLERLAEDLTTVGIDRVHGGAQPKEVRYLLQAQTLNAADWTIYLLSDLHQLQRWTLAAVLVVGALLCVVLVVGFYLYQRRQYLRQLVENSIRDPLTRLYTRIYMRDAIASLEALQDREHDIEVALVLFDLDHFKRINDTYGHRVGDIVLRAVSRVILDEARESDVPVRWGGEELAVFLNVHGIDKAMQFAERVRMRVAQLRPVPRHKELRITVSAGIALRQQGESLAALMERGDRNLYEAKRAGRNCVRLDKPLQPLGSGAAHRSTLH